MAKVQDLRFLCEENKKADLYAVVDGKKVAVGNSYVEDEKLYLFASKTETRNAEEFASFIYSEAADPCWYDIDGSKFRWCDIYFVNENCCLDEAEQIYSVTAVTISNNEILLIGENDTSSFIHLHFNSPEELEDMILSGNDLYNPVLEQYVFVYNDKDAIAVYSNIEIDYAKELQEKAEVDDEYWGAYLGAGGVIYDCPSDYTTTVFSDTNWMPCKLVKEL